MILLATRVATISQKPLTAPSSVVAVLPEVRFPCISQMMCLANMKVVKDEPNDDGSRRRKKRNRWGDATENKAAGLMGLPTAIMANMTSEQLEAYTLHLRIEEISQKLRIDDVVPADGDRYVPSLYTPLLYIISHN